MKHTLYKRLLPSGEVLSLTARVSDTYTHLTWSLNDRVVDSLLCSRAEARRRWAAFAKLGGKPSKTIRVAESATLAQPEKF